jgi:hypothetical protein
MNQQIEKCSASQKSTGIDWKYIFICIYAAKLLYLCLKSSSELKPWFPDLLIAVSSSASVLCIDGGLDGVKSKQGFDDLAVDGDIEDYPGSKQKSDGRRSAAANGMPSVAPTPTMFPIAAVPPPVPVQDYILPGSSNQMIPNQEIHPELSFKGSAALETGLKGFIPGHGSMDHARNFQQQRLEGSFQRGDTNTFPNDFGNKRNNVREQGGRFNHGWNSHRGFNARDNINMQTRVGPRNFLRPPPPFIGPSPAFINAPGFHGPMYYVPAAPPEPIRGAPYFPHASPPGVLMPGHEPSPLRAMVIKQIEYYFSFENLIKDNYLRSCMDARGWVPISIIAKFNRVRSMTTNVHFILDALRSSNVVEVQGDKLRKREDWSNWLLPSGHNNSVSNTKIHQNTTDDKVINDVKSAELDRRSNCDTSGDDATSSKNFINRNSFGVHQPQVSSCASICFILSV